MGVVDYSWRGKNNVGKSALFSVYYHKKNSYAKLQVHSRSEAVVKALRERLV
jgi:hypothetical protein